MQRIKNILKNLYHSPQNTFLLIAGVFGFGFILLTPPFQTPDEVVHFMRAYQVSELHFISSAQNGELGSELPKSIDTTVRVTSENLEIKFNPNTKYDIHNTVIALKEPLNKENREFLNVAGAASYAPIGYIPQAIAIAAGAVVNMPAVVLMYMARAASLFAWLGLIYLSIKLMPQKKWAIVGVSLLPMVIAQAGAPGVDAISMGLAVLFIAFVMKLRSVLRISGRQFGLLLLIAALIALTKQTTILVIGFIFLLRPKQFDIHKFKAYAKIATVVATPVAILLLWTLIVKLAGLSIDGVVENQNSSQQLANLIHHPWRLPEVIFNTFFFTWGDGVVRSLIGEFGWLDTQMGAGIITLGYILLAFVLLANYEPVKAKLKLTTINKWVIAGIVGLYVIGTCAALYIVYTPVDFDIIYGLQGRYFLLTLFMLIPLLATVPVLVRKKHYVVTTCVTSIILLSLSALTIYMRYYVVYF